MLEGLAELERRGIKPLEVVDGMALVPAFNDAGYGVHTLLMESRLAGWSRLSPGYRDPFCTMKPEVWKLLAHLLVGAGIRSVCGQVASGSSVAFALQVMLEGALISGVLGKDGYAPAKHYAGFCPTGRVAIVDDVVADGNAMRWSITKLEEMNYRQRPMLFSFYWSPSSALRMFGDGYELVTALALMGK